MTAPTSHKAQGWRRRLMLFSLLLIGLVSSSILFAVCVEIVLLDHPLDIEPLLEEHEEQLASVFKLQDVFIAKIIFYVHVANHLWFLWFIFISGLLMTAVFILLFGHAGSHVNVDLLRYYLDQEKRRRRMAEKKVQEFDDRLMLSHEEISDAFMLVSVDMRLQHANYPASQLIRNWADDPHQLEGQHLQDMIPGFHSSGLRRSIQVCIEDNISWEGEIHLDPINIWLLVRVFPANTGFFVHFRDISHRKKPVSATEMSHTILQQLALHAPLNVAIVDKDWKYLIASQLWLQNFHLVDHGDITGEKHQRYLPNFPGRFDELEERIKAGKIVRSERIMYTIGNNEEWITWEARGWRDQYGEIAGYILFADFVTDQLQDTKKRKNEREKERMLAYHDLLTGLPNRQLFYDRLNMSLAQAYRQLGKVALMFLDLDGFKAVNDNLGHDIGDMLLKEVAQRLQTCVRETDTVARLGGDEFTIILNGITDTGIPKQVSQKVLNALQQPFHLGGHQVKIGTSIGICLYPADASSTADLMKGADTAMYRAKESGKGMYIFYSDIKKKTEEKQK